MGHTKEIWDASQYDQINGQQYRDAKETIEKIIADNIGQTDIILDIGCGSGNVTKMLSSVIPHKKMYSCDFDAQMVSYADKNYNDGSIEYFVQDIGLPWEELDERLRNLEGKVDLVWSNRVLHWVKDKATAAKTIGRLLKPGGRCYINTTLGRDINEFLSEDQKKENQKYFTIPTHKEQSDEWNQVFNNCGLSKVDIKMLFKEWIYNNDNEFHEMETNAAGTFVKRFVHENIAAEKREEIVKELAVKFVKVFQTKYGEDLEDTRNHNNRQVYYEQFRIIGIK